jgi:hypothetical protein
LETFGRVRDECFNKRQKWMDLMQQESKTALHLRVQLVDNWHDDWTSVLKLIDRVGKRNCLQLDEDGWLSARQNLLVAFAGGKPVGFFCFRVEPQASNGKPVMVAVVEACEVDSEAGYDLQTVARELRQAAMNRALELRCQKFLGATCVNS